MKILKQKLRKYLEKRFNSSIKLREFKELRRGVYGKAYLVDFETKKGRKKLILKTMKRGGFGHDYKADIAHNLILADDTFNKLPKHVKSYDVVAVGRELVSIGGAEDYYILMEAAEGLHYSEDLDRILEKGLREGDLEKARELAKYLAEIHETKKEDQALCTRRARDLVGHGEYIMGVIDSYSKELLSAEERVEMVKDCIEWWQKLQEYSHRLCVVHGDFHPFNIVFKDNDFKVLDRSRGEFGEPAEDIASLAINYVFWSLIKYGKLDKDFKELWDAFMLEYLERTEDKELPKLIQPFFAFRALVVANPAFYSDEFFEERGANALRIRKKLINFAKRILKLEEFDTQKINKYLA